MRFLFITFALLSSYAIAHADSTDDYHAECQKVLTSRKANKWLKAELRWLAQGEPITHKLWSQETYLTPLQALALGLDPDIKVPAGRLRVTITPLPTGLHLTIKVGEKILGTLNVGTDQSRVGYLYYEWDREVLSTTPGADLARSAAHHLLTRQAGGVTLGYGFNSEYDIYRRSYPAHDDAEQLWLEVYVVRPCPGRPAEIDDFIFPVKGTHPLDMNLCLTRIFGIDYRNQYGYKRPRVGAQPKR